MSKVMVNNAIILAAGRSTRFMPMTIDKPKALVEVKGEILIERLIRQLLDAKISEIIVVTGYLSKSLDYLSEKFGVTLIHNPEYMTRNNHSSLYYVQDYLKNSLICSSDNYYQNNVFTQHEDGPYYSTIYSNGPTEEWCVGMDSAGFINSVDIGGSNADYMIGHAFFDEKFSKKFIEILNRDYDKEEILSKLWESIYAENLDSLKLKVRRFNPGDIEEFDSLDELKQFDKWYEDNTDSELLSNISVALGAKISEITNLQPLLLENDLIGFNFDNRETKYNYYLEDNLIFNVSNLIDATKVSVMEEIIGEHLENSQNVNIKFAQRLGGLTNKNYLVKYNGKSIVFRLPGEGSNELINRHDEATNIEGAKLAGIDAVVLYFDANNGIKITEYIEDALTLSQDNFKNVCFIKEAAFTLKKLHNCQITLGTEFDVYDKINHYEKLINQKGEIPFIDYQKTRNLVLELKEQINDLHTFCHNDPLPENFLAHDDILTLIDWEYAGMNHPYWDIAAASIEAKFDKEQEAIFLKSYFGSSIDNETRNQVLIQKILVDFLWSLWGLYFTYQGQDYMGYSVARYENCLNSIEELTQNLQD